MADAHPNARLEAFCDGVFAIALTLLIIDIRLPAMESIGSTAELWRALQHMAPSVFAFVSSFCIILITWVNHRGTLRLVHKSSGTFIYANGFLLLTVVFIPFPTTLLGAFIWTDHAGPAVFLYDAVLAVQGVAWLLVTGAAIKGHLLNDERATSTMGEQKRRAYFAFTFYSLLAVAALWFPVAVAVVTTASWLFWLTLGLRINTPE